MRSVRALLIADLLTLLLALCGAQAAASGDIESRLLQLAGELRCVVCQNETLAASQAPLAQDLRALIRSQLQQGQSDLQIRDFMVARYGEFVLYRPPLAPHTLVLWLGPFVLLGGGLLTLWRQLRQQQHRVPFPMPDQEIT